MAYRQVLLLVIFARSFSLGYHPLISHEQRSKERFESIPRTILSVWKCLDIHLHKQVAILHPTKTKEGEMIIAATHKSGAPVLLTQSNHMVNNIYADHRAVDIHVTIIPGFLFHGSYRIVWRQWGLYSSTNILGQFVVILTTPLYEPPQQLVSMVKTFMKELGTPRLAIVCIYPGKEIVINTRYNNRGGLSITSTNVGAFCQKTPDNPFMVKLQVRAFVSHDIRVYPVYLSHGWIDRHGYLRDDCPENEVLKLLQRRGLFQDCKLDPNMEATLVYDRKVVAWMSLSLPRHQQVDYCDQSTPLTQEDVYMVVRKAGMVPFLLVLLLPFCRWTWMMVGITLVAFATLWYLLHQVHSPGKFSVWPIGHALSDALEMTFTGIISYRLPSISQRIAVLAGAVLFIVAGSAYQGLLLGFLTVPKYFEDFNTLSEAAQFIDTIYASDVVQDILETADDFAGRIMFDKIKFMKTYEEETNAIRDITERGRSAITMTDTVYEFHTNMNNFTAGGHSLLHRVPEPFYSPGLRVYLLQKNNLFSKVLNRELLRMVQAGLYAHWSKKRQHLLSLDMALAHAEEKRDLREDDRVKPLRLEHFAGPFILLGSGICVGVVCFVIEVLHLLIRKCHRCVTARKR